MDCNYNGWTGIQPNPSLYPNPPSLTDPYASILQSTSLPAHQSVPLNPNPSSYTLSSGHESQQQGLVFVYGHANGANSVEATAVYYQNLVANEQFRLSEVAALSINGGKKSTPANVNSNIFIQPQSCGSWKSGHKKNKIQSVWCEACKLEFNSKTVLDQHKLGKKHKRSLDKLRGGSVVATPASAPFVASEVSVNPFVGLQETPGKVKSVNGQDAGKKTVELVENLETKRQKVLEGGAATNEVRTCLACNVVCNSETVFRIHLAGKKHIANMSKQEKFTPAAASLVPSEVSVNTFIGPQEKPDKVNLGNGQDAAKKAAEMVENLETKRQKVLEEGAATNEVRVCLVCNVVCNSETVFKVHLAGKKHIANMKKQASGAGVVPVN
ncbi:uncharacterized protein LOC107796540 [Nicotiana tabacum]|uniref:Uncharacterized protein LOC107796540 n=2 Tax=Nicotiana TaxID=4085 RepID=A0A1S4ADW1_TOBAC|nr:PREDICTED: zinc finger protein 385B-like [Nicotiana sylvestris]XP_016474814.1 PREDICTED: zinc finger protein 385B-like [Nicotiana tabacum]